MATSDESLSQRKPSGRSAGKDHNKKSRRGRPLKDLNGDISEVRHIEKFLPIVVYAWKSETRFKLPLFPIFLGGFLRLSLDFRRERLEELLPK